MRTCPACDNSSGVEFTVREMMFGTEETFAYTECSGCGCLYVREIPSDMSRYYPDHYYSYEVPRIRPVVSWARRQRARSEFGDPSLVGGLLRRYFGAPDYSRWMKTAGIGRTARILDVGAGGGRRVQEMTEAGFSDVTGVEPYLGLHHLVLDGGAKVFRDVSSLEPTSYDMVMMHHSFEHMPEPVTALRQAFELLEPSGWLLIRTPVAGTYAWRNYGTNWVQLDAPRHLAIYSEQSIKVVAERAQFVVEASFYDSTAFQFWGSQLCVDGVPLSERHAYATQHGLAARGPWRSRELGTLEADARRLNEERDGDQAAFFLRRTR